MPFRFISDNDKNMAIQLERRTIPMVSPQSIILAKQARLEQQKRGYVIVTCPKCQEHPRITTTLKGERTFIGCSCGFIKNAEINF